jgi:pantoate--beta-alanine ligase
VREPDGLALSSRNAYLAPEDRRRAVALSRALREARAAWSSGETRSEILEQLTRESLEAEPGVVVEYIAVVEPEGLTPIGTVGAGTVIALAARVGGTRLIDNVILGEGAG